MTIEHRLYRAANEVRELPVEIPDFAPAAAGGTTRRLLPTVVTSLLFLVGAFAVLADDAAPNADSDLVSSDVVIAAPSAAADQSAPDQPVRLLTPREELVMITSLGQRSPAPRTVAPAQASTTAEAENRIPPGAS